MSATLGPRFDPARRRAVTLALLLVSALASFESTVVSTAMPTIIGDLGGLPLYAWVFSMYLLTSTIGMPVYGRLADVYGRRRVLLSAIVIFLAGALACAFARTMPALIVARALQGLGAGGMIPVTLTIAADIYSLEERAKVQGFFSGVWGFASLAGPLAGAFLTVHFGWRSIFTINVPLGLIALAIVASRLRESRASLPDPIDLAGASTLALGFALLLFGVMRAPGGAGEPAALRPALFAAGIATLTLFVWLQMRREHPLVPPELFRRWETASPYLAAIVMGTMVYAVDAYVPLFVQGARGGTATAAGAVVTPLVLMWALSAAAGARMVVRVGFRFTARVGAVLALLGIALLLTGALVNGSVAWMSVACGVIGAGLGPSSIAQVLAIQHVAAERQRGIATSLVPFFRTVGGSLGVGALGGIFAAGLSLRLGGQMEAASRFLAGAHAAGTIPEAPIAPAVFSQAIERSLVPVFAVLLALAAISVFLASGFPATTIPRSEMPGAAEGI
ncbi:MAG: MFS transporter [Acidobacteria bacterium]|nr:MFS transporter [Acidobacteriota bacterium]MCA1609280.1 MFS transporter [Acidobacteriota bacterium]